MGQMGSGQPPGEGADLKRGLPMVSPAEPEALAREQAELSELAGKGLLARWRGYFGKTGPGWLQSAVTLGGGSAMASLFAGAYLRYDLLWVQPLAMVLGVVMLAAVAHQTLSTNARPFGAMKRYFHPSAAWAWAIATLVATVIWHLPQYALAAGMTEDMIRSATGLAAATTQQTWVLLAVGGGFLVISTAATWSYGSGGRGVRLYERMLKCLVWMIVLAFAVVIVRSSLDGRIRWGSVGRGFLPLKLPTDPTGFSVVMAALGAAVGINMTFLFPYTLLGRHWGRAHRGLARFDLVTGMLLPYCLATSLMVIAAGCTIYDILENYTAADFKDLPALARKLTAAGRSGAATPAGRVWAMLDEHTRQHVRQVARTGRAGPDAAAHVAAGLNAVLMSPEFYSGEHFRGVRLPPQAAHLLTRPRAGLSDKSLRLLNRQAIDSAFPELLKALPLKIPPAKAAAMIQAAGVGKAFSRFVFGLGILGMALSTITVHMLMCGFAACEIFGIEPAGWKYKLACLIPAPAVLGVVLWKRIGTWVGVPTSAVCGLLLPIAYVGFFVLNNRRAYLGKDLPRGGKRLLWNAAMLVAIAVVVASGVYYVYLHRGFFVSAFK